MKKFIVTCWLALGLLALAHQPASAWVNSRFGIGLYWNRQAGGNSILGGLYRNGQPPGPEVMGGGYGGAYGSGYGGGMSYGAPQYSPDPQSFQPMPQAYPQAAPQGTIEPPPINPPQSAAPYYYSGPYQFANNPRPMFYYPNTWYGGR